jgi:hypothetical protein
MTIIDKISEKLGGKHDREKHHAAQPTSSATSRAPGHGQFPQTSASGPEETGYDETERRKGMGEKDPHKDPKDQAFRAGSGEAGYEAGHEHKKGGEGKHAFIE